MIPKIIRTQDIPLRRLEEGSQLRIILDSVNGANNLAMGWVSIEPGKRTSTHTRNVEEVTYILRGEVFVVTETDEYKLTSGDTILIPAGTAHYHENRGEKTLKQIYIFAPQGPEKPLRDLPIIESGSHI